LLGPPATINVTNLSAVPNTLMKHFARCVLLDVYTDIEFQTRVDTASNISCKHCQNKNKHHVSNLKDYVKTTA
jgi:hypothetical protein